MRYFHRQPHQTHLDISWVIGTLSLGRRSTAGFALCCRYACPTQGAHFAWLGSFLGTALQLLSQSMLTGGVSELT